jgi:hypothetical protein
MVEPELFEEPAEVQVGLQRDVVEPVPRIAADGLGTR